MAIFHPLAPPARQVDLRQVHRSTSVEPTNGPRCTCRAATAAHGGRRRLDGSDEFARRVGFWGPVMEQT